METLYQKYRPFSWDKIAGNPKVVKELQKRVKEQKIPSTVYINGSTGTGKSSIARLLAASISCEHLDANGNPCGKCRFCNDITSESFSLATYFFNASNLGIEEMRSIDEISSTRSITSKYKIIIIDELQELNSNKKAMKNILVTLERQTKHVFWILLAMDDSKVEASIKNRCVSFKLQDIESSEIAKYLKFVCDSEKIEVTPDKFEALFAISENCNGSMRTALSYLERVIEGDIWTEKEIISELGIITQNTLSDILGKILKGDPEALNNEFNLELIGKMRWLLSILYKYKIGVSSNRWLMNQISQIKDANVEAVQYTIQKLNTVNNFLYTDKLVLESLLIDCILHNKEVAAPVVRRKLNG